VTAGVKVPEIAGLQVPPIIQKTRGSISSFDISEVTGCPTQNNALRRISFAQLA
jgi:hypothetical protein